MLPPDFLAALAAIVGEPHLRLDPDALILYGTAAGLSSTGRQVWSQETNGVPESAATGDEVTPTWLPDRGDPTRLRRIWTGDIEIHISADIAHAAYQYWQATGDDEWLIGKGLELILHTAKFWASRTEWNAGANRYEYNDVIGPDEYHEHVDNNAYTNRRTNAVEWSVNGKRQDSLTTETLVPGPNVVRRSARGRAASFACC